MKYALLPAALLGLSACGAVLGGPETVEESVEDLARHFNRPRVIKLPSEFDKARIEAEVVGSDMVVLRILDLPSGHETIESATARKILRPKLCDFWRVRNLFKRGGKLRVELVSNIGTEAASFQMVQC